MIDNIIAEMNEHLKIFQTRCLNYVIENTNLKQQLEAARAELKKAKETTGDNSTDNTTG
jgi:hypothetical protein